MDQFAIILVLTFSVLLNGCATPNTKYSELRPPSTAAISGEMITLHVGSDVMNSACFTKLKVRVEGQTVLIVGYRTLREQSREFKIRLPVSVIPQSVLVVWVDPDGSRIQVPITK